MFVVPRAKPNSRLMASRHNPNRNVHTTMLLSSSTVAVNDKWVGWRSKNGKGEGEVSSKRGRRGRGGKGRCMA